MQASASSCTMCRLVVKKVRVHAGNRYLSLPAIRVQLAIESGKL